MSVAEALRLRASWLPTRTGVALLFVTMAALALPFADLAVTGRDPWGELGRLFAGLARPDFGAIESIAGALALTIAFAIAAVALGATAGFLLAPYYFGVVRAFCVGVRSIHELVWALLFMQVYGISVTTGVLAIALPYAGIFAKVFAEYLDAADPRPRQILPQKTDAFSAFLYARLPLAAAELRTYTRYRLECAIRSSAVLGFIGLPTLGFQLDTYFKQGGYGEVGAILLLYFALIGTVHMWMRRSLAPLYVLAAVVALALVATPPMGNASLWRFLTVDIVPQPLRGGADLTDAATWSRLAHWAEPIMLKEALPGALATLVVAQLALVLTGFFAIVAFPIVVPKVVGRLGSIAGHIGLVVGRSSPEYMLAYVMLQVLGPSMLPAILALGLHNGAIIAHLLGRQADEITGRLRADASRGLSLYAYELVPRLYASFLALCLYRWEIIIRESAIVGMLGVATLGFFIDNGVSELRLDRVMVLLVATVLLTAFVDMVSRRLRSVIGARRLTVSERACQ